MFLDFQFIFAYGMRGLDLEFYIYQWSVSALPDNLCQPFQVVAMALFRKAASLLGRTVGSRVSRETSVSNPSIFQAIRCMSSSKVFVGGTSPYFSLVHCSAEFLTFDSCHRTFLADG